MVERFVTKLRPIFEAMLLVEFLVVPIFVFDLRSSLTEAADSNALIFQKGTSYATYANMTPYAYCSAESDESLRRMKQTGVDWVAINVVGWYQTNNQSADIHENQSQAPTDKALAHVIESAHNLGMKVMLKPMIDLEDGRWRGEIQPSDAWFQNYTAYIKSFAEFAQRNNVEMFCIGTEYKRTTSWARHWRDIISSVRSLFHGQITYAAVWDEFFLISWWSDVDYAGLNAYFHLSDTDNPTREQMKANLEIDLISLDLWYTIIRKPIIFTEVGYLSVNGTNQDPSNYKLQEDMRRETDLQEQADCYEATFQAVWIRSWFYGMYWWYWQTNPNAAIPLLDVNYNKTVRDYTPQNKPAQGVIVHWYWAPRNEVIDFTPFVIAGIALMAVVVAETVLIGVLWKKYKALKSTPKA
jgi:hypothetical protein